MKIVMQVKTQARHPLQITVLVWWILACVAQLIAGAPPGPITIEPTTQFLLLALLTLSSVICLIGSLIRDVILGLALEKYGWIGIVLLFVVYGLIVITLAPSVQVGLSAVMFPAFIMGGLWRIGQIRKAQKRLGTLRENGDLP